MLLATRANENEFSDKVWPVDGELLCDEAEPEMPAAPTNWVGAVWLL
jgi:hypothetical protein